MERAGRSQQGSGVAGGRCGGPCERTRARPLRLSRNRVTAQVDSWPSRTPITFGVVTRGGRPSGPHIVVRPKWSAQSPGRLRVRRRHSAQGTVRTTFADSRGVLARGEATGSAHSGPHSPLCGSESGDAPSAPDWNVGIRTARSCGSESGDAPSAQGTVRTTFADIPGVLARDEDTEGLEAIRWGQSAACNVRCER